MSLGNTISRLRKEKGWTQGELAEKLQMNANHVSRWETDRILPRKKALGKLAELFQVSVEELMGAVESPPAIPKLAQEDPELAGLVGQITMLSDEHRVALRTVLRTMLTCQQMEQLVVRTRGAA